MHALFSLLTPIFDVIDIVVFIKLAFMGLKKIILTSDYNFAAWSHMSANHEGSVVTCDDCATHQTQLAG